MVRLARQRADVTAMESGRMALLGRMGRIAIWISPRNRVSGILLVPDDRDAGDARGSLDLHAYLDCHSRDRAILRSSATSVRMGGGGAGIGRRDRYLYDVVVDQKRLHSLRIQQLYGGGLDRSAIL